MTERQLRWVALSVLFLSSGLNYLDRMVLSALMPTLRQEFRISGENLGHLLAAFYLPYAFASPLMGLLIDRIGLRWGASLVVALWSAVGIGTGFVTGFASLLVARAMLGLAESGGIPATAKGAAVYLEPRDRALGSAISQIGLTLGTVAAPLLTEFFSVRYGWRSAFVAAGTIGFVWIPVWLFASLRIRPVRVASDPVRVPYGDMLRDKRYLALLLANVLSMAVYGLWTSWVTYFLVTRYSISQADANLHYAWIPPIFATLGGLFGGWLAQGMISRGRNVIDTRLRIAGGASVFVLATALAPVSGTPLLATAAICLSLFSVTCLSVNYYSIPLDLFGADRAAFGVSFLTGVFGLMLFVLSPQIGRWSDQAGWQPVCTAVAVLPFVSVLVLRAAFRKS